MKLYSYITKGDDGSVNITYSGKPLPLDRNDLIELSDEDIIKYDTHITYIDCCSLNGETLEIDPAKLLVKIRANIVVNINDRCKELKTLVTQAAVLDNKEVAQEIASTIKTLMLFPNSEIFSSNLTNIDDILNISCPELLINHQSLYTDKLYGI